jgi:N-acetylmuramoyl-L-alanine amidase
MHYDCIDSDIISIQSIAVQAFQQLWNIARPTDKIATDGDFGPVTQSRLSYSPAEGFGDIDPPRMLKLTEPIQIGKDVGELQLALRRAGISLDKADQIFGPTTDQAVKEFQAANSLVADGIVGNSTRKALGLDKPIVQLPPQDSLINVFKTYGGSQAAQQEKALQWLQGQLSQPTLDQFSKLWRNDK